MVKAGLKISTKDARRAGSMALSAFGWLVVAIGFAPLVGAAIYRVAPPPGTFTMLERSLGGRTVRHDWTPLEAISPHLVRAVIAAEDSRYCQHAGIDVEAIREAAQDNKRGGKRRGGSTISQQTAKNVFLWNGGGYARKGLEAWFTLVSETVWGKRRTMELYLNVAEWGDGLFGAEAAARARFGKGARDLTKQEAALLAAVLPSPNKWRAVNPGPYVRGRAATIRKRMEVVRRDGLARCVLGAN